MSLTITLSTLTSCVLNVRSRYGTSQTISVNNVANIGMNMAYAYICDACRNGHHDQCEKHRDIPPEGFVGGGICVCRHRGEQSVFEQSISNPNPDLVGDEL